MSKMRQIALFSEMFTRFANLPYRSLLERLPRRRRGVGKMQAAAILALAQAAIRMSLRRSRWKYLDGADISEGKPASIGQKTLRIKTPTGGGDPVGVVECD
jgi:hypothetical protein